MSSFQAWFLAVRPKTLPAAIVPVWAGCMMAWEMTGLFSFKLAVATLFGAVFIQIATNFFNDMIDSDKGADTENRLGPKRVTVSGLISREAVFRGAFLMLFCACLCGLYLWINTGWLVLVIGIPSLYLSYGYTGGPFPLAYRGLGEVFVILFFGLIAVGGTFFIQTGFLNRDGCLLGLQIGLLSTVLIAINNYRDVEEDEAAGKMTIAVRFGRPFMASLIVLMTILPYLLMAFYSSDLQVKCKWIMSSLPIGVVFLMKILKGMRAAAKTNKVESQLLGIAALHLLAFVVVQTFVISLT